jgi:hypothetical protein
LDEGGAVERGICLIPSRLGIAQRVVEAQRGGSLPREQLVIGALRCREPQADALACGQLRLQGRKRTP